MDSYREKLPIKKWNKELLELHKKVCKTYLVQKGVNLKTRNKFFRLYEYYVSENNIQSWFYMPIWLCIQTLVTGDFDSVFKCKKIKHKKTLKEETKRISQESCYKKYLW